MRVSSTLLLALSACTGPVDFGTDTSGGLLGKGAYDVFPNATLIDESGHVALPADALPATPSPLPIDRIAFRTGFSPVQTSVVKLTDVDPDALPSWRSPTPGSGGVLLLDLDSGEFYPVMAELDAYPDDNPEPVLLIRPQQALPYGHRVAVVVTTAVTPRPARFETIINGPDDEVPADFGGGVEHWRALMAELEANGIAPDTVALAWDYPVGDGTIPLRSALSQLSPPGEWDFTRIRTSDESDLAPGGWKAAEGTFGAQDFLVDDDILNIGQDGSVTATGTASPVIVVHIPESVKDAPAGSVPVLIYGHGIFSDPAADLDSSYELSALYLADELGMIVIGTRWRGLDYHDLPGALTVANDFGQIPLITDRMVQGQVNTRTLVELVVNGDLLDDAVFQGAQGQKLADVDHVWFEGISMGSIEGAVLIANGAPVDAGVLHIGGSCWSTLLERSSNWSSFERLVVPKIPNPQDRQLLYSISQLWFDPVDPAAYADDLADKPVILQENIGDNSVHNIGTTVLARSIGLPVLNPAVAPPADLELVDGPLQPGSRALVQFDPMLAEPPDENRPSPETGAHGASEGWPGTREQMRDFLNPVTPAEVVHHCGDEPCSRDNKGSYSDEE